MHPHMNHHWSQRRNEAMKRQPEFQKKRTEVEPKPQSSLPSILNTYILYLHTNTRILWSFSCEFQRSLKNTYDFLKIENKWREKGIYDTQMQPTPQPCIGGGTGRYADCGKFSLAFVLHQSSLLLVREAAVSSLAIQMKLLIKWQWNSRASSP